MDITRNATTTHTPSDPNAINRTRQVTTCAGCGRTIAWACTNLDDAQAWRTAVITDGNGHGTWCDYIRIGQVYRPTSGPAIDVAIVDYAGPGVYIVRNASGSGGTRTMSADVLASYTYLPDAFAY